MQAAKVMCAADEARRAHDAALATINAKLAPVLEKLPGYSVRIVGPVIVEFDLGAWAAKLQAAFSYEGPLLPTEVLINLETDQRFLRVPRRADEQVARALIDKLVNVMPRPPTRNEVAVIAIAAEFDPPITYEAADDFMAELKVRGDRWRKKKDLVGPIFDLYNPEDPEALYLDHRGRYCRGMPPGDWEERVNRYEPEGEAPAPAPDRPARPAGNP